VTIEIYELLNEDGIVHDNRFVKRVQFVIIIISQEFSTLRKFGGYNFTIYGGMFGHELGKAVVVYDNNFMIVKSTYAFITFYPILGSGFRIDVTGNNEPERFVVCHNILLFEFFLDNFIDNLRI
jgi:hypothetical protein